ncbi:DUF2637 domain-containing protein [Rhodococcus hoagii]|nr:DUF2637 domain-containing protein [Prescottella equi]
MAVLAFALSYSNLAALAGRAGYGPVMAHVWPLVVDGLAVVATAAVMRLRASRVYAWSLLAAATAVSIVAGAAAHLLPAGPLPGWAGAGVAVVPPLCLLVAPHLAVQLRRDAVGAAAASTAEAPAVETAAPAVDKPAEATVRDSRTVAADQQRRTPTQPEPVRDALFDVPAPNDAPASMTRDEMKAEARSTCSRRRDVAARRRRTPRYVGSVSATVAQGRRRSRRDTSARRGRRVTQPTGCALA